LRKELEAIEARRQRRNKAERADAERKELIRDALRRLEFLALVGKAEGVQLRCRRSEGKMAKLNDLKGTVLEVGRTQAVVDFAGERWRFRLSSLQPAGETQAMELGCFFSKPADPQPASGHPDAS
jgi:hypothetical protein